MLRSRGLLRAAAPLAIVLLVSACEGQGDKGQPLTSVEPVDIPPADVVAQQNVNINNPALDMQTLFPVSDGDLLTPVWEDEFDDDQLDPATWFFESGDGQQYGIPFPAWGNKERQYYLPDNARLEDGKLKITAKRETVPVYWWDDEDGDGDPDANEIQRQANYTSGRIMTRDRFAFKYGRIEASIKFPSGQGLFPAFWMLPQDDEPNAAPGFGNYGVYAQSGEIDIVEAINLDGIPGPAGYGGGNEIFSTIHFGGSNAENREQFLTTLYTPSEDVTEGFNTYAFEWDETQMRWYFNGVLYKFEDSTWSSDGGDFPAPFDQPFYVLFNLGVGGDLAGPANGDTPFPATMEVDWVRVYSGEDNYVPADRGTVPDDVIYASDPGETVDLVFDVDYTGFNPFGSGSDFNGDTTFDRDFSPAFGVTVGFGYNAWIGQFAIEGFAGGFATAYESLQFKAKNLSNDIIRVQFLGDGGDYLDINLADSPYSTALGNGWYEVVVPIADFTGVAGATGLLFETDNAAPNIYTFLLTDFGFNVGDGGGGPGGGELVLNSGFDEPLVAPEESGWERFENGGTVAIAATGGSDGGPAANLNITAPGNPTIKQTGIGAGALAPNQAFSITFDWKGTAANGGVITFQVFSEQDGGGVTKADLVQGGDAFPMDWTTVGPLNFTTAGTAADIAGGLTLEISAICGGVPGCVSDLFIDNVIVSTDGG